MTLRSATAPAPPSLHYRREIDGLRALAVLPVLFFHAGFATFRGGFVGVDVFFVISGYLITTIIITELSAGRFSIVGFYERRARRILPALFLVILVCLPFAWEWFTPRDFRSFSQSLAAVAAFVSNILFWRTSFYFDPSMEFKPLLHTWSLAVEEQYYLFFPVTLLLIWRLGRSWVLGFLGLAFLVSLLAAQWGSRANPGAAFYLLPTRGWELLVGVFAAFYLADDDRRSPPPVICEAGAYTGLALIAYSVFVFDGQTPFPSLYTLVPTLGAALLILFATPATGVGRLLGNRIFVGVGLISYSAYLWHQPLLAFARYHSDFVLDSPPILASLLLTSLGLAYLTWRYVETPFRNRQRISRKVIFSGALAFSAAFLAVGLLGARIAVIDYQWPKYARQYECLLEGPEQSEHPGGCFAKKRDVLLWGDSHAAALYPGLARLAAEESFGLTQLTQNACPPVIDVEILVYRKNCNVLNEKLLARIAQTPYDVIVLHAAWQHPDYPMDYAALGNKLDLMLKRIKAASPATRVILVSNVPRWYLSPEKAYYQSLRSPAQGSFDGHRYAPAITLPDIDRVLSGVAQRNGVVFISPVETLCLPRRLDAQHRLCMIEMDESSPYLAYADWGHLSKLGSEYLVGSLRGDFMSVIGKR